MAPLHVLGACAFALAAAFPVATALAAAGGNKAASDATGSSQRVDSGSALVQFYGEPLATDIKTKPPQGKKIDFDSSTVKSYRAQLSALRNSFKTWLRANAPRAQVTGEFDLALNAVAVRLNGEALGTLAAAPMVRRVEQQGVYYPTIADPDLSIISAVDAWNRAGGASSAGEGVKVAVVDTGIDVAHPCFGDTGYARQTQVGDPRFTNNKVIAAKVFNNKTPSRGYTAEAIESHGTHVAGTIGCNHDTPATVSGVTIPYRISGVAPRALLGNYNVFPADVANARSEDILNALEAAYADGFDVANMSLGGGAHGIQDLLTVAVDNLDQANMVVAVAAGNSGPGHFTVESPGSAARALTAGATTVPHFVGAPVSVSGSTFGAASGEFAVVGSDLTAPLGVVLTTTGALSTACTALTGSLAGKIALIARGTCTFSAKIRNAQNAGASAVLVANNVQGDPVAMASDGTNAQPSVPAYMVSLNAGSALKGSDGQSSTISATLAYFLTTSADFQAGFSSQGPTDVDFRIKPDVMAPGVNVLSSIPVSFCGGNPCFAFFQGTSMATPHLAGSAAIVRHQHPDWSAAQIRSAVVNTADQGVVKTFNTGAIARDPNVIGSGRENLLAAVESKLAIDPVSVSFGAVPSGSGQSKTFALTLTNLSAASLDLELSVSSASGAGVSYSVTPTASVAAGGSTVVVVAMSADKGAGFGDHNAVLSISSGGAAIAHAAVYTLIK
jgi:subtilisin family serine protease